MDSLSLNLDGNLLEDQTPQQFLSSPTRVDDLESQLEVLD